MASDQPQMGSPIIDPTSAPSIPTTYDHRDSLVETKSHNSWSESMLLPDSPLSGTDSLGGEVWIPRLSGGLKRLQYGGRTLTSAQTAGNHGVGTSRRDAGYNPNNRQDENTPVPSVPPALSISSPRSVSGLKAFKKSNRHLSNHENVNHAWSRKTGRIKGPEESTREEDYDREESSLTGCEYESDDLAEDISHGLAYGHRKQPTSTSSPSSDEYVPDTVNELLTERSQDQPNNYPHRSSIHEPVSNIAVPENLAAAEKSSRFKILGKNGFFTSWKKATKTVNLEERGIEEIPRDRHYEGCILCPPQPSPRSSVTSTVGAPELYAPSGQNPGPPPLTPPPSPTGNKDIKGKSPAPQQSLLAPTSYNVMKDLLGKHDKVGQPGPSNYYQGASNRRSPFNNYPTYLNRSSNSSNDSGNLGRPSKRPDQAEGNVDTASRSLNIRLELSSGDNEYAVKNDTDGNYDRDPYQESQEDTHNRAKGVIKRRPLSGRPSFLGKRSSRGLIRLPDNSGEGPHPGSRRNHQYLGADGIYEMVEIGSMSASSSAVAPNFHTEPVGPIQRVRTEWFMQTLFIRFKREVVQYLIENWKLVSAVTVVVSVLLSMILLLLVIIPNIMRDRAGRATFEVAALHISDISYNYTTVTLDFKVIANAGTRVNINPASFSLESDNDYNYDFYHSKKEDSKNKSELYRGHKYTPIGELHLYKGLSFSKGNGNMVLTSETADDDESDGNNDVAEPGFWRPREMVEILVWGAYNNETGMRSVIRGDVRLQARGFATWVDIQKEVNINSMGGFQDLKIDSYKFLQPQKGFIDANISWFNPSVVTMNMGTVDFDLFLGDLPIGDAKIPSMAILPGYNHAHLSSSLFDRDIFRSNKTLLGELISSITLEEAGPTKGKLLHLNGRNTTVGGTGIEWLQPIIQLFDKDLPVAMNEQIFSTFNTSILLTMTPDGKTKLKRGSIECKLKLPFESEDFLITVRGVGYFLDISLPPNNAGFLRIESTMNSHDHTVLSGVHTFNSSLVGSNSSIIEENVLKTVFMPDFIKAETLSLKVSGSMVADLETPYGEGRISGIKVENHIWQMKGLHGLDGGGKSKVIISNETVIGNIWTVTLQIQNPSDMFVDFGDTVFDVIQTKNSTGCIGTISVEKLALDYGSNNVTGNFDLTAPNCNGPELAEFLSNFMTGGQNNLNLRTTSSHEVMGFTGLEVGAEWISPGYRLFNSIDLIIGEYNVMAKISLKNPFDVVLTLDSVDMELVLADKVIAALTSQEHSKETVMGGQSATLSGIRLTPVTSIQGLVETFQRELLSETSELMAITASGKIRLLLADYEVPLMNYKQENVEVKLRWEI